MCLQRETPLAHALAQAIHVAGEQTHPDQRHQQHAGLQQEHIGLDRPLQIVI